MMMVMTVGYKCRVDENAWTGANKKILEHELASKKHMLENIEDLEKWCEKAGVCADDYLLCFIYASVSLTSSDH